MFFVPGLAGVRPNGRPSWLRLASKAILGVCCRLSLAGCRGVLVERTGEPPDAEDC